MRVPPWTNQYSIESSGRLIRTSRPVSSATSRTAVCSRVSPGFGVPLRQRPRHDVAVAAAAADDELGRVALVPNDDSAGRSGGRGPQPRHGAVAALERRSVPARPERAQCIVIEGRGRPSVGRTGRAARKARQPPRRRARTLPPWRRMTVGRVDAAWNEPAARRPSRDSRARADGRRSGRRTGRVLRGDASFHGPQW